MRGIKKNKNIELIMIVLFEIFFIEKKLFPMSHPLLLNMKFISR